MQANPQQPGGTYRRNTAGHQQHQLLLKGESNSSSCSTTCFLLDTYGNLLAHFREKLVRVMEVEDKNIQGNDLQQQLIV